ncbi:MAG TPA: bifunctional phosphopantothenoylcysteine decarboxylase/phosphopantothenate--cysteine ligase CoaBC [Capsulimonadaceae bacterium]|nr:bifunctional phosphopantothenoylcysteine decarboxylase/phosphopantothenate--cysteine ligase CoaBC [Capsulimonadaceae bacterium]
MENSVGEKRPKVVLGVSASIAAYKAADLASQMVKAGIDVYPVLTQDAARFIGPITFEALTGNPCPVGVFDEPYPGEIAHIHLARIADAFVIAPASMNVLAELANGIAKEMLTAAVLATKAPVLMAPAMNTVMWEHPATQANLSKLTDYGYFFIDPVSGRLACRTEGMGKMADVPVILEAVQRLLSRKTCAEGKRVLVTAGPTQEPIDPVRFISNRSSGKMGYALAEAARDRGAQVALVSGPTALPAPTGMEVVRAETASQMQEAVMARSDSADIIIQAAAIADFRPATVAARKIKKNGEALALALEATTDFSVLLGRRKRPGQVLVGFAAETENLVVNARKKLVEKNLDLIVANDVSQEGAGFDFDTNIVTLIDREGNETPLPLATKREVAEEILDRLLGCG